MAQALAGVQPGTISHIEAHGTGTALGDPIEIAALTQVFRADTQAIGFCAVGSVKTNIGHLDPAAGIAGLIKTVLALEHRTLPPSVHFQRPNPAIDFASSPFYVASAAAPWPEGPTPRRAGVSSFGIGGTNAHLVLEEAPGRSPTASRGWQLLVISARSPAALDTATANLARHLDQESPASLADLAFTLQAGRTAFANRRALVCRDLADARTLGSAKSARVLSGVVGPSDPAIAFMFPGQGAQYVAMGRELYLHEPVFAQHLDYCARYLFPHLNIDFRELLYSPSESTRIAAEHLQQTAITQPVLFAIEYALAQLWMAWGVRPTAMIGHSIGEYVAACLAGVFSLDDGLELVAARGRLLQQLPVGAMLAVALSEAAVQTYLDDGVALAALNTPDLCVVSGPQPAIERLAARLAASGIEGHRLPTSHAFHSPMMDPALAEYTRLVQRLPLSPPQIPFVSNVTGDWITPAEAMDPAYWTAHLRRTVRFADGVRELLADPARLLLEVGPGRTLATMARRAPNAKGRQILSSLRHPDEQHEDTHFVLETLARLWLYGAAINWPAIHHSERRHKVALPTYPFERQRYWIDPPSSVPAKPARTTHGSPNVKMDIADWLYAPSWRRTVGPDSVEEHAPGSSWLVLADATVGPALIEQLESEGCDVVHVVPGGRFDRVSERAYTLDPTRRADYEALAQQLRDLEQTPRYVAHLWGITTTGLDFEASQQLGFYSLIFLMQTLAPTSAPVSLRVLVASCGTQAVLGGDRIVPAAATSQGLCRVIPQEYLNVACCHVDLENATTGVASSLIAELRAGCQDAVVAYRRGHRWVESFQPLRTGADGKSRLREGGVYLITGGLGRLGLILADDLVRRVRATVVLTTRSAPSQDRLRALQRLEAQGGRVLVEIADVADAVSMTALINSIVAQCGALDGVVHLAGLTDESSMAEVRALSPELCEAHFRPKARGLLVLTGALRGQPLDFVLLFSSLSTVLGGLRMAAYASANTFMNAAAAQSDAGGSLPLISVAWDGWERDGASGDRAYVEPREGLEVLHRILAMPHPPRVIAVSSRDLEARLDRWIRLTMPADHASQSDLPQHARPDLAAIYVAPRNGVEERVANLWKTMLGVERIGIDDNFFELGGHSLLVIQLASRLRATFDIEVGADAIFDTPTIAGLATTIERKRQTKQDELNDVARMLDTVEKLSESEIRELLAAPQPGTVPNE